MRTHLAGEPCPVGGLELGERGRRHGLGKQLPDRRLRLPLVQGKTGARSVDDADVTVDDEHDRVGRDLQREQLLDQRRDSEGEGLLRNVACAVAAHVRPPAGIVAISRRRRAASSAWTCGARSSGDQSNASSQARSSVAT